MFLITTTGTLSDVVFDDLGARTFSHPVVDYDLEREYDIQTLTNSDSIQNAIDNGYITVTDGTTTITNLSRYFMSAYVYDKDIDDVTDNTETLDGFSYSHFLNVNNLNDSGTSSNVIWSANKILDTFNTETRNNTKIIKTVDDFPTAVGSVITLEPETNYDIDGSVNIGTNRLSLSGDTSISGRSAFSDSIVYTGTASMITGSNMNLVIRNVSLASPSTSNIVDLTNDSRDNIALFKNCVFSSAPKTGTINGFKLVTFIENAFNTIQNGFTLNGPEHIAISESFFDSTNSGTYFELTGNNIERILISNNYFHLLNVSDIGVLFDLTTYNIPVESGLYSDNTSAGEGSPISGFTSDNDEFLFSGNKGLLDTNERNKTKVIRTLSNFPDPTGSEINLLDGWVYDIDGVVNLGTYSLNMGAKTTLRGDTSLQDTIIYTGTQSAVKSTDNEFYLKNLRIEAGTGSVFNISDSTGLKDFTFTRCEFINCNSIGSINGSDDLFFDSCFFEIFNDGITLLSTNGFGYVNIHNCSIDTDRFSGTGSVSFLKLSDGVSGENLKLTDNHFHSKNTGDVGIEVLGVENFSLVSLNSNDFFNYTNTNSSPISGAGVESENWIFSGNLGIENTSSRSDTKIIRAFENLPTPIGNIIQLENRFTYDIDGIINVGTFSLKSGTDTVINGKNTDLDGFIYTGTGSLFIAEDVSLKIDNINVEASNGEVINFQTTAGNEKTHDLYIRDLDFNYCQNLGTIENPRFLEIIHNTVKVGNPTASGGFDLTGLTCGDLFFYDNLVGDSQGTVIDFGTSIWDVVTVDRNTIHAPDFGIVGLTGNQNLSVNGIGRIANNSFIDGGTYISGLDGTRWDFLSNGGGVEEKSDVLSSSEIYVSGNATATTIGAISTPVAINATTFNDSILDRFSHDGNGLMTYLGNSEIVVSVDATIFFTGGNNQDVNFYFAVNGTPLSKTFAGATTTGAGDTMFCNPKGAVTVTNGDTIQIFVENDTSATSVTVTDMNWTIGI